MQLMDARARVCACNRCLFIQPEELVDGKGAAQTRGARACAVYHQCVYLRVVRVGVHAQYT